MIPSDVLVTYFIACIILAIAPGPDNIFVLTQSALRGRKAGILVVLGLCSGLLVHTTGVSLGVAVIFQTSELAFTLLKLAGAGYLIYLAWGAFRAGATEIEGEKSTLTHAQLFRRGIIMNITNPKVTIFFLAFLPQFANPARGSISIQMLILGGFFILASILVFGAIALAAGTLGDWLKRSEKAQKVMNRVAGVVFLGLAAKLLLSER
ncbi:LysE family translocator [Oxalobacter vibrioformis]|uniref:LysE family translocator n=1 Tax=Oxalobacter vibrioformis TaxID=933080 RepID=A0A9E9LUX3_9BURK|nr:LysE family translocator [Oxalobacter vibrioformis]WAW09319.1 LysE family translocator [Oxalobacter vibrioformis]